MRRWSIVVLLILAVAAIAVVAFGARGRSIDTLLDSHSGDDTAAAAPLPPTLLVAVPGHAIANGTKPLTVTLSAPVSPTSPPPTLIPKVAGTWSILGDSEVFTPVSTLEPCSSYALTVWARTSATGHTALGHKHTIALHVACPPLAGLQQALARLGYLGVRLHPLYDVHIRSGPETRREAAEHAFHPPRGRLAPDPSDAPPHYRRDPISYTWVTVSESLPETLDVHEGHRVVFTTPVNTGVPGAETAQGIFPIYARYVSTTMSGEDVDGTKYDVPDVPWVNYFNGGDAVHGYPREAYGFPQSNGCVELPIEAAHTVFGMLAIGDIVEVDG
jgi:hypothetical protein